MRYLEEAKKLLETGMPDIKTIIPALAIIVGLLWLTVGTLQRCGAKITSGVAYLCLGAALYVSPWFIIGTGIALLLNAVLKAREIKSPLVVYAVAVILIGGLFIILGLEYHILILKVLAFPTALTGIVMRCYVDYKEMQAEKDPT